MHGGAGRTGDCRSGERAMRVKEKRLIVTFRTTTDAMAFEAAGREYGLGGRLIPVPRALTAGCGLAWSEPPERRRDMERLIGEEKLTYEQIAELVI